MRSYTRPVPWGPPVGRGAPGRVPWGKGCSDVSQDVCRRHDRISALVCGLTRRSRPREVRQTGPAPCVARVVDLVSGSVRRPRESRKFRRPNTSFEVRGGSGQHDRSQWSDSADLSSRKSGGAHSHGRRIRRWVNDGSEWVTMSMPCPWRGFLPWASLDPSGGAS